jgi:hypothetical protein
MGAELGRLYFRRSVIKGCLRIRYYGEFFGPKRNEVMGEWGRPNYEELNDV